MECNQKTAFFFDLDNTLFDYEASFKKASLFAFRSIVGNKEVDPDLAEKWFTYYKGYCDLFWPAYEKEIMSREEYQRTRLLSSMTALGLEHYSDKQVKQYQELFEEKIHTFVEPFEWVNNLIQRLNQIGIITGIITNGESDLQRKKIKKLGLQIPEKEIYISSEINITKPNPEIFHFVRKQTKAKNLYYVGDAYEFDIKPAVVAGWTAIWWNPLKKPQQTVHPCVFNCSVGNELYQVIKKCTESAGYSLP